MGRRTLGAASTLWFAVEATPVRGGLVADPTPKESESPDRASAANRTVVIVLAQVVVIVALLVVWSIVRGRCSGNPPPGPPS